MSAPADYRKALLDFSGAIRDPRAGEPENIEPRRMAVYQDLFFNNLNGFLSNGFPVFRSLMPERWWQGEVRNFMRHHRCRSPLFCDIGREYLDYVNSEQREATPEDPPFMAELLHYEWVELALDIAPAPSEAELEDLNDDLLAGHPVLSSLAWLLEYQYPVHQIAPEYQPVEPPEQPTWLLVYRNREDRVAFMALNAFSARLLALLEETDKSGEDLLRQLSEEAPGIDPEAVMTGGEVLLQQLYDLGALSGARVVARG